MNNPINLPVKPKQLPVLPLDRWLMVRDDISNIQKLVKVYSFDDPNKYSAFLFDIIEYQQMLQHYADMNSEYDSGEHKHKLTINIWTRNIDQVTNIDKEFARYCDITYKNLFSNA